MKYVITGSIGNISRPLVKKLIAAGHHVSVISSNESRSEEIKSLGATSLIGSVTDVAFQDEDAAYNTGSSPVSGRRSHRPGGVEQASENDWNCPG